MKYEVIITRIGSVIVEAEDKEMAIRIASYKGTGNIS